MNKPHPDTCLISFVRFWEGKDGKSDSVTVHASQLSTDTRDSNVNEFDPPMRVSSYDDDVIKAFRKHGDFPCLARLSIRPRVLPAKGELPERTIVNIVAATDFEAISSKSSLKAVA